MKHFYLRLWAVIAMIIAMIAPPSFLISQIGFRANAQYISDPITKGDLPSSANLWYDFLGTGTKGCYLYHGLRDLDSHYGFAQIDENGDLRLIAEDFNIEEYHYIEDNSSLVNLNNDPYIDLVQYTNYYEIIVFQSNADYNLTPLISTDTNHGWYSFEWGNDGRMGIIDKQYDDITGASYALGQDGDMHINYLHFVSPEGYTANRAYGGGGFIVQDPSEALSFDNIGRDGKSTIKRETLVSLDFNNDGIPDLMDTYKGLVLINCGDNKWIKKSLGGNVIPRDLNGDGLLDYVVYSSTDKEVFVCWGQPDGSLVETTILSGYNVGNYVWCFDVDKDGDVDIILPFNAANNNGNAFLMVVENKGDGTFKKHEYLLPESTTDEIFFECMDIDADGNYEVLLQGETTTYYRINGLTVDTTLNSLDDDLYPYIIGDYDNSGRMAVWGNRGLMVISDNINQRPIAPKKPTLHFESSSGYLDIQWEAASDAESSAIDLTYELRIGTAPDLSDIYFAAALADGTRRDFKKGNQGYSLRRVLNTQSWPAGKYYVSVQAIDPNHRGSAFSEYAIFEKAMPSCEFEFEYLGPLAVTEECLVKLVQPASSSCNYTWDFADAKVLASAPDESWYRISFSTPGTKAISLCVSDGNGNISTPISHTLDVCANRGKPVEYDMIYNIATKMDRCMAIDLDCDGQSEAFGKVNNMYVYDYYFWDIDENDQYTKTAKLWNSNPNFQVPNSMDINKDGRADIFELSGKMILCSIDEEDLELRQLDYAPFGYGILYDCKNNLMDLNNDGFLEVRSSDRNDGTGYLWYSFDENMIATETAADLVPDFFFDYNHDGLIDAAGIYRNLWGWDEDLEKTFLTVYINKGNFVFEKEHLWELPTEPSLNVFAINDFDNDNLPDMIYAQKLTDGPHFYIRWGDGQIVEIEDWVSIFDHSSYGTEYYISMFDFDNNGYIDFTCDGMLSNSTDEEEYLTLSFFPNRQFEIRAYEVLNGSVTRPKYIGLSHLPSGKMRIHNATVLDGNNSKPQPPTNLRASQNSSGIQIEWDHSIDVETSAAAMNYNLSVKKAGAAGGGAYLISPGNAGKNGVHVPSDKQLIPTNIFFIPIENIEPGEYEIKVQGVDSWRMESDFSDAYTFTVLSSTSLDCPTTAYVGIPVTVTQHTNTSNSIDWDGATSAEPTEAGWEVTWSAVGLKQVKVGDEKYDIYVHETPNASFSLPERVMAGDKVNILTSNTMTSQWAFSPEDDATILEIDSTMVKAQFLKEGTIALSRHFTENGFEVESTVRTEVVAPTLPQISIIDTDTQSGCYRINLQANAAPQQALSINLYRETAIAEEYQLIANLPLGTSTYVDAMSSPKVSSSAYCLSYVLEYGESAYCATHRTLHSMINIGANGAWNIIWTPYVGVDIATYQILRGTQEDNLEVIALVSGYNTSYSDTNVIDGQTYYYAVEAVPETSSRASSALSRSNVVSTNNALNVKLSESIAIKDLDALDTAMVPGTTIQLQAEVLPINATYRNVDWIIEDGADVVSIDYNGVLTALEEGVANLKVVTKDGSNLFATCQVTVTKDHPSIMWSQDFSRMDIDPDEGIALEAICDLDYPISYSIIEGNEIAEIVDDKLYILDEGTAEIEARVAETASNHGCKVQKSIVTKKKQAIYWDQYFINYPDLWSTVLNATSESGMDVVYESLDHWTAYVYFEEGIGDGVWILRSNDKNGATQIRAIQNGDDEWSKASELHDITVVVRGTEDQELEYTGKRTFFVNEEVELTCETKSSAPTMYSLYECSPDWIISNNILYPNSYGVGWIKLENWGDEVFAPNSILVMIQTTDDNSVTSIKADTPIVRTEGLSILVENFRNHNYRIFNSMGVEIYFGNDDRVFIGHAGVFLICFDNCVTKVILK